MSAKYSIGVLLRAIGAGGLALFSKAAAVGKGAGGASGALKGLGGLALGGGAAAAIVSKKEGEENVVAGDTSSKPTPPQQQQRLPSMTVPPPPQQQQNSQNIWK